MSDTWYVDGLRFDCQRCGDCCTGGPGYVFLRRGEGEEIASFLGVESEVFRRLHTRRVGRSRSLKEESDGRCVFFSPEGCLVYRVRPQQCRTFPFWPRIITCRAAWDAAGRECPGIGRGRLFGPAEIEDLAGRLAGEDQVGLHHFDPRRAGGEEPRIPHQTPPERQD